MHVIDPTVEILSPAPIETPQVMRFLETIGRTCYQSEERITDDSAEDFARKIMSRKHEAMLEHYYMTVRFTCDRGVSHEIVRHRIASFAQESTRYCNYSKDKFGGGITYIDLATGFNYDLTNPKDSAKYDIWRSACMRSEADYLEMLKLGASPQEARSVLINSTKTVIVMTANIREWRHFCELRADGHAHPQMQEIAYVALSEFKKFLPVYFEDFADVVL